MKTMNLALLKIENLLKEKGASAHMMQQDLGIKPSTYYTWKSRDTFPSSEFLLPIAKYLGVTVDYLLSDEEEPIRSDEPRYYVDQETKEFADAMKNNPGQRVLFDAAKDLPAEDLLKVLDFIHQQTKKEGHND